MVLYIFVLFVGIVVCFNMFMFLVMVSRIWEKDEVCKFIDYKNIGVFFWLLMFIGVFWLFGFLVLFIEFYLFFVLYILFIVG